MSIAFLEGAEYAAATSEEQKQITKIGERATCATCNKAIVYGSAGWLHQRRCETPHAPVPATSGGIIEDPLTKALERVVELEALVETQGNRIQTLLAENAKLVEKVRK